MTWKLTGKHEGMEPIPGAGPWRDMDDEEFRDVARDYAERNPDFGRMALHHSGFWEHVEDKPEKSDKGKED